MGIDFREDPARGAAFARKAGMTYPSLSDEESGGVLILALQGKAPTVPTTLVLDTEGRIAAGSTAPCRRAPCAASSTTSSPVVTSAVGPAAVLAAGDTVTSGALPLALAVAALAGLVSFASPCVLPLVPGFLGYVTGLTGEPLAERRRGANRFWAPCSSSSGSPPSSCSAPSSSRRPVACSSSSARSSCASVAWSSSPWGCSSSGWAASAR